MWTYYVYQSPCWKIVPFISKYILPSIILQIVSKISTQQYKTREKLAISLIAKVDGSTRKAIYKFCFHCVPLKSKIPQLLELKLMLRASKKGTSIYIKAI